MRLPVRSLRLASFLLLAPLAAHPQGVATRAARLRPPSHRGAPPPEQVLGFDDLPAGTVLAQAFTASGFGPVRVHAFNPFLGVAANAALVFDTAFPTGGDFDLGSPNASFGGPGVGAGGASGPFQNDVPRGRVLIVAENLNDWEGDGLVNSPDDLNAAATQAAMLDFDFELVGPVTIHGLTIVDVEASELPPILTCYDADGVVLASLVLPATGDNGVEDVDLGGIRGVRAMEIQMRGSGAVDDVRFSAEGSGSLDLVTGLIGIDLTPDGSTALFFDQGSPDGDTYFYDTIARSLAFKTTVGSPLRDFPTGISASFRVSAHHGDPVEAGLWTEAGGWLDLGNVFPAGCGVDQGSAWDLSADGSIAVGLLWNGCNGVAFRWTQGGGLQPLDLLGESFPGSPNPPTNRATKIADDGSVIGGFAQTALVDRWPALWQPDGSGFLLPGGVFPDDAPGEVLSMSGDGSMVAGIWNLAGFYWTAAEGVVPLPPLPNSLPGGQTFPNAIAADGQLVFGKLLAGFFDPAVVFVFSRAAGTRSLVQIAAAHGVAVPDGWTLDNVLAASADGSILCGTATDPFFRSAAFVLRLPVSSYGL